MMRYLIIFAISINYIFAQANIYFKEKVHNFGKIYEEKGDVSYDFIFKNTGNKELTLTNVKASCGCTTPDWPKYPIKPGETGTIHVSYNPVNRPGPFNKSITISSNAKNNTVVLKISGEVIPRKKTVNDLYPDKIGNLMLENNTFSFTKVYNNQIKKSSLNIYNPTDKDMLISFENVPKHISLSVQPRVIKAKSKAKITGSYNAKLKNDWGYVSDKVFLKINGVRQTHPLKISARIVENFKAMSAEEKAKAPKLSVDKRLVNLGKIKENEIKTFSFTIKNTGKTALIIRKIDSGCSCFKIKSSKNKIAPNESAKLLITLNPKGRKGKLHKIITIINNDPQNSVLRLQVKADVY